MNRKDYVNLMVTRYLNLLYQQYSSLGYNTIPIKNLPTHTNKFNNSYKRYHPINERYNYGIKNMQNELLTLLNAGFQAPVNVWIFSSLPKCTFRIMHKLSQVQIRY